LLKEKWPKENQIETPLTFQLGESLLVQLSNIRWILFICPNNRFKIEVSVW